jgi:hypothetical protein
MNNNRALALCFSCSLFLFVSCHPNLPDPVTPVLQTVNLHGMADCPTPGGTCSVPTTAATQWALDPDYYVTSFGRTVANRRAVIVVDTPLFTDLSLSYTAQGQTHAMTEVPRTAAQPGIPEHYAIQTNDDGTRMRWFMTVSSSHCTNPITFHVVDVGRKPGNPRSAPLDVTLTMPAGGGCGSGPGFVGTYSSGGSSSSTSSSPSGSSSCPPNHQLFRVCQKCQASAGATPIYFYSEGCYTSWQSVQTVYGSGCTLSQVSGPSGCELP